MNVKARLRNGGLVYCVEYDVSEHRGPDSFVKITGIKLISMMVHDGDEGKDAIHRSDFRDTTKADRMCHDLFYWQIFDTERLKMHHRILLEQP